MINTRNTILDAAIDLFITEGFETTSMDAIAASAGVAKGTLYYHFKSKEGIVEAIVGRYITAVKKAFASIEADATLDPLEKLAAFNEALRDINSESFTKLHHMRYIDIHEKTRKAMAEFLAPSYARIFEEGNKEGLWTVPHALEVAEILVVAGSFLFDPENDNERSPDRVAAFVEISAKIMGIDPALLAPAFTRFTNRASASADTSYQSTALPEKEPSNGQQR